MQRQLLVFRRDEFENRSGCGSGDLIQIDVAYWLSCRDVFGFLHGFFEFFGEDVFFVVFQVPRVAEFIFAIALLLIQNAGGVGEVDVWAGFGGGFMGKHGAEYRVDYQFRVAAWASDIQVVYILLGHGKYSTPFWRVVRSSDGSEAQGSEDTGPIIPPLLCNEPSIVNNDFQPVSMRYFLSVHRPGSGILTLLG